MIELTQDIDLINPEFLAAWNLICNTHQSVFLTGKAGTGKSTFLRYICQNTKKNYVVLAPTGIAAMNVGGATLHSFFQIPLRPVPPNDEEYSIRNIKKKLKFSKEKIKIIKTLDLLIIDEISMVRPDITDFIDRVLRSYSDNKKEPFGGKQLLLVGDIFQLEPVVTSDMRTILSYHYENYFFFNAKAYEEVDLVPIELKKIYRQNNPRFVEILDRIRVNNATSNDLQAINSRFVSRQSALEEDFTITLAARRDTVDAINDSKLEAIPGEEYEFKGMIEGDFPEKLLPTDLDLVLKVDAQIIFLKNDKNKRWVNGTIGKIHDISSNGIRVELESGDIHLIEPFTWHNIKYTYDEETKRIKEETLGSFTQYPIKAAWALTVHKSQGLTFNRVVIDLAEGAFSSGQTYVALSRCTSLEGITLHTRLSQRDIIVNNAVVNFSRKFNDNLLITKALDNAQADALYLEALESFYKVDIPDAVAKLAKAITLRNDLEKPSIQRFISSKLNIINKQKSEIDRLNGVLSDLAKEYIDMGGECLNIEGASEAAIANFEKALRLDSNNQDAMYGKSLALLDMGKYNESLNNLLILFKINARHYQARCLQGLCHFRLGSYDRALIAYNAALKIKRTDPDLHLRLAECFDAISLEDMADKHRELAKKYRSKKQK